MAKIYKVIKEDDELYTIQTAAGYPIAEANSRYKARKIAANPKTLPLDVADVSRILGRMGWELVDVTAFFQSASACGLVDKQVKDA